MSERIVLQRATEARDSFGEPIKTWGNLAQVWAAVEWQSGSEAFQADREYAEVPVELRVRRSTTTMSLREKDRALVASGVTEVKTTLGTSTGTSLVVNTPGVFPPENEFCVRIGSELLLVASGAGTVASPFVVSRGAYGTTADTHMAGQSVIHMIPLDVVGVSKTKAMLNVTTVRGEVRTI